MLRIWLILLGFVFAMLALYLGGSFNLTVLAVIIAILATGIITSIIVGGKDEDIAPTT